MKFKQGYFKPKNPHKYAGDVSNIVHRSGLELRFFKYFDEHPEIALWASEERFVQYKHPIDGKVHRYFFDLMIKTAKGDVFLVEIKPFSQTIPPVRGKNQKAYMAALKTWEINKAKWSAANAFAENHGAKFMLLTEKDVRNKYD